MGDLLELTPKQWRAVASVYHLYVVSGGSCETPRNSQDHEGAFRWLEGVLPALKRAFPPSFLKQFNREEAAEAFKECDSNFEEEGRRKKKKRKREEGEADDGGAEAQEGSLRLLEPAPWRREVPADIDKFLSNLFQQNTCIKLSKGERILLRLLNREQMKFDRSYERHSSMKDAVRQMGEKLLALASVDAASGTIAASAVESYENRNGTGVAGDGDEAHVRRLHHVQSSATEQCHDSPSATSRNGTQTQYAEGGTLNGKTNDDDETRRHGDCEIVDLVTPYDSPLHNSGTSGSVFVLSVEEAVKASQTNGAIEVVCAECGEGGSLFQCVRCNVLRHEACGGPKYESEIGYCKVCCREMGMDSDTTSLRSSTSTEERLMAADDDSDTSLSGFIVNSDDEEEEDDEDEGEHGRNIKRTTEQGCSVVQGSLSSQSVFTMLPEECPFKREKMRMKESHKYW